MRLGPAYLLVLIATLLAPFVIATTWLTGRVDDRQDYVDAVAPLAQQPAVRRVLANAAAEAAVEALEQRLPVALPDGVRNRVADWAHDAATTVTESPDFPRFWREANESLHPKVLALLKNENASTRGQLSVDAGPLVAQVLLLLEDRNIPVGLLPDIGASVPVVQKATVARAGPEYRAAHRAVRLLQGAWLVLVGLAILVAPGWRARLRTAGVAGLGFAAVAGVAVAAAPLVADVVIDKFVNRQQELAKLIVDALLDTVPAHAQSYLWVVPVSLLLLLGSFWPHREPEPDGHLSAPPDAETR
ncbi:MAG: hypothetical protein L0H31_02085 [Nocardioidaceae bacterium]|nr:hypothetical protein [Nocardioidaceae bacterium]